jgi:hypothetical protein
VLPLEDSAPKKKFPVFTDSDSFGQFRATEASETFGKVEQQTVEAVEIGQRRMED